MLGIGFYVVTEKNIVICYINESTMDKSFISYLNNTTYVSVSELLYGVKIMTLELVLTDNDLVLAAKKERGKGNMLDCLDFLSQVRADTGETNRLTANTLIDLDMPYTAYEALSTETKEPLTNEDKFKNLDVDVRILYKMARYDEAIEVLRRKIALSEDKTRELPLLLWIAVVAGKMNLAYDTARDILGDKSIYDLSPYEIKSLVLFDNIFEYNKYKNDQKLIEMSLDGIKQDYDNGPWCYILSLIDYQDKAYIKTKFFEHKYFFESTILGTGIPTEFRGMRVGAADIVMIEEKDKVREELYSKCNSFVEKAAMGLFPL